MVNSDNRSIFTAEVYVDRAYDGVEVRLFNSIPENCDANRGP